MSAIGSTRYSFFVAMKLSQMVSKRSMSPKVASLLKRLRLPWPRTKLKMVVKERIPRLMMAARTPPPRAVKLKEQIKEKMIRLASSK